MSVTPPPVPLVIVTGFLGVGKTTTLNRLLGADHRRRLAVIVNELGRIDIDGRLLKARAGDVMELVGGCVCHEVTTQEQLYGALEEIIARSRPERILLETTGIAEPDAIVAGLWALPPAKRRVRLAGIVTVVDAEAGLRQLERHAEARAQAAAADRLLITKLDRSSPEGLAALHRALGELNRDAERASFPSSAEGTAQLVPWLLDPDPAPAPWERERRVGAAGGRVPHGGHSQLEAFAFREEAPLAAEPLLEVLRDLGDALLRAKGFVNIAGEARRGFVERAGNVLALDYRGEWPPGTRQTELVLIGEGLDTASLERRLWACRVPGGGGANPPAGATGGADAGSSARGAAVATEPGGS